MPTKTAKQPKSMNNLDAAVFRALKAYKFEQCLKDKDATKWAEANLQEGIVQFLKIFNQFDDLEGGLGAGMDALKEWATPKLTA